MVVLDVFQPLLPGMVPGKLVSDRKQDKCCACEVECRFYGSVLKSILTSVIPRMLNCWIVQGIPESNLINRIRAHCCFSFA